MQDISLDRAEELLEYLRPSNSVWGSEWDSEWVFRGHADSSWELQAPAFRPDGRVRLRPVLAELARRIAGWSFAEFEALLNDAERLRSDERLRMLVDQVVRHAEHYAVTQFAELSDELGLLVDEQEKWRNEGFQGPSLATALAQHHGVPTSLLDWTRRPLVAAYFSVCEDHAAPRIAVWALNARLVCDPPSIAARSLQVFRCPRSAHAFLHAQDGLFTCMKWNRRYNYLMDQGRWPTVPMVLEREHDRTHGVCLRRITLPRSEVNTLRRLLWRERVSRAHLMPTFDNVRAALASRWRSELEAEGGANLPQPVVWSRANTAAGSEDSPGDAGRL